MELKEQSASGIGFWGVATQSSDANTAACMLW